MATKMQNALDNVTRSLESYFYSLADTGKTIAPALEAESETQVPDILIFQFGLEELFDDVKLLSASLAKYAGTKDADLFDRIVVAHEDRFFFDRFCKSASLYAYSKVQGLAKAVNPAFLFDEGVTIVDYVAGASHIKGDHVRMEDGTIYRALADVNTDPEVDVDNWEEMPDYVDTKNKVSYLILNNVNFDSNVIRVWDDNLKDMIVLFILEKIYTFRNIDANLTGSIITLRVEAEARLTSTIHSRKKPVRRSAFEY